MITCFPGKLPHYAVDATKTWSSYHAKKRGGHRKANQRVGENFLNY